MTMLVRTTVAYQRIHQIGAGEGRNSIVYLARDEQFGGDIVVKEVPKADFRLPERYFDEAQALYAARSQNVVPLHWASQTNDLICLAMPHYPQGSLARRIEHGPLLVREVVRIAQEVCAGAATVHRAQLLHLDIKPSNVLFNEVGNALLADFGQAVDVGNYGVATGSMRVYQLCAPPELLIGRGAAIPSDVFQLGMTLYRAANGSPFFHSQVLKAESDGLFGAIVAGKFPTRDYLPHVPRTLRTVLSRAMSVDPAERYQSATELAEAVAAVRVELDWHVDMSDPDVTAWRADRDGRASIEVHRITRGRRYNVEARRGGRSIRAYCAADLNAAAATRLLNRCFRKLR